ncbi:MAG: hypothetical protein WCA89_12255 [Terracidiphilus sp.]
MALPQNIQDDLTACQNFLTNQQAAVAAKQTTATQLAADQAADVAAAGNLTAANSQLAGGLAQLESDLQAYFTPTSQQNGAVPGSSETLAPG